MRTTLSAFILCICALVLSQHASAATKVIGVNGQARTCYVMAKAEDARGISMCTSALDEPLTARDRAATFINRSALRIMVGDNHGALSDCDESIRHFAWLGESYLNRGVALRALGQPQESIAVLTKAIEVGLLRPQLAYYDRAMAKEDVGDTAGAYRDYKAALDMEPGFKMAAEQLKRFRVIVIPDSTG